MIQFTIPGEPQGKGRPRMTKQGHAFTPQKTVLYENWIKCCFLEAKQQKIEGDAPIHAIIGAYYPIPKSASKNLRGRMIGGVVYPTKKPDCDNIIKAIFDSLNGLAYDDDKQIVSIQFAKHYSDEPRVSVQLKSLAE